MTDVRGFEMALAEKDARLEDLRQQLAECQAALALKDEALMRLAEHDSRCEVFDLDDNDRHKQCSCGLDAALSAKPGTEALEKWLGEPVGVFADVNSMTPENGTRWEHMVDESYDGVDYVYLYAKPKGIS